MPQTALILGASGRIGRHTAHAFERAGWEVRRYDRSRGDLIGAAEGADVIVNGWNPPYSKWGALVPGLTAQVIDAARASGATVLQPGNVYVFGRDMPGVIGPDTPHLADHPLGRIRRQMEASLKDSGVQAVVIRAGDFIDDAPSGNWFDRIMAKTLPKGQLSYPGTPDIAHAWAWLPDLAAAFVAVAETRRDLGGFTDLAFGGYAVSGDELAQACGAAMGTGISAHRMSWLPVRLARPFWPEARHLLEMRYLWNVPHRLDGSALRRLAPGLPETPVEAAVKAALDGYGITSTQTSR